MRIAIEGPPGVGKSTLCRDLATVVPGLTVVTEPVSENQYLNDYYESPKRWALAMQIDLLTRRVQAAASMDDPLGTVLYDRSLWGDRIFGEAVRDMGLMEDREFATYDRVFQALVEKAMLPDVIIALRAPMDAVWERVGSRGRSEESGMTREYLSYVHQCYERFAETPPLGTQLVNLDWTTFQPPEAVWETVSAQI